MMMRNWIGLCTARGLLTEGEAARVCKTPGSEFQITVEPDQVGGTVMLPPEVSLDAMDEDEATHAEDLIHDALEEIVAKLVSEVDPQAEQHWDEARANDPLEEGDGDTTEEAHWRRFNRDLPGMKSDGASYVVRKLKDENGRTCYLVVSNGHVVGRARLSSDKTFVTDVSVRPELQRRGIATALYRYIESDLGHALKPSPLGQTGAGKALWTARQRGQGDQDA